jgi:sec-independent protein translocase protein TatC
MAEPHKPPGDGQPPGDVPMTVWEHLGELRKRLILSIVGLLPGVILAWVLHEELVDFLAEPLVLARVKLGMTGPAPLNYGNPVDPFVVYMHVSLVCGLLFASPWIAYQVWAFIAPGLYSREKRYAIPFAMASAIFFLGGAFFGYRSVLPVGFEALYGFSGQLPSHRVQVVPMLMLNEYLGFATQMLLGFGIVFEVPVVIAFLAMAGLVNWKQLLRFGRYWVLIASILAAVLTPSPDVGSMMMMMTPLVVLYFAAVGVAYLIGPKVAKEEKSEAG